VPTSSLHRLARDLGAKRREELAAAYAEAHAHLRSIEDHRAARFYAALSAFLLSDVERAAADLGRAAREALAAAMTEGRDRVQEAGDKHLAAWKSEVIDLLQGTTDAEDAVVWHTAQQLVTPEEE
jgi:hypothetical protein